jgi:hypothetical protein
VYACSFSLGPVGAREKEPKREAPKERFALCGARPKAPPLETAITFGVLLRKTPEKKFESKNFEIKETVRLTKTSRKKL